MDITKRNNDLVSVVVPVYNVEQYLRECINSLIEQTYKNIEIILVDDGSTDGSPLICDEFQRKDCRVKVIHKSNGGLSTARNKGLETSRGEYILFIDSDDTINDHMIERMIDAIFENDADISCCAFRKFENNNEIDVTIDRQTNGITIEGNKFVKLLYQGAYTNIAFVAWNKLYKKSLFLENNIEYPVGRIYEDAFTTYKILYVAKKVTLINETLYNYRIRNGSIMKSAVNLKKTTDAVDSGKSAIEFFRNNNEKELMDLAVNSYFRSQIVYYKKINDSENECKNYLMGEYRKMLKEYLPITDIKGYKKIIYKLFKWIPSIVSKIY